MRERKEAKEIVNFVLQQTRADQTEAALFNYNQALTRFANNYIHQNVNEANAGISIRVIFGKKIGSASTNSLDRHKIEETIRWAEEIAKYQRQNKDFISLPKIRQKDYQHAKTFTKSTEEFSNRDRARAVSQIIEVAKKHKMRAFGSVSNGTSELCIGNSLGTFAYAKSNDLYCNIVMTGKNSTGYVQVGARDASKIDFREQAEVAAQKALMSADPIGIRPGPYPTILEPLAASELLDYLGHHAFNSKLFQEGRSYLVGKLGKKIVDERVTVIDDPFNEKGYAFPFDFEGFPKRRLVLIDRGVAKGIVYDSLTATRARKKSTGHALPAPNPFGPIPTHIFMRGGTESVDDMIKSTKKGILVTRFHYTNIIDPHKLIITGMTRDGTFLIENGKIVQGIKNLRFTENIIEALNRVEAISKNSILVAAEPGYGGRFAMGSIVPTLKIRNFNFTSATEF